MLTGTVLMNISKSLNLTVLSFLCVASQMAGHCQVYTLSTPITGYLGMAAQDVNGPAGSSGGFYFTFSNLTETVYLDTVAQTIRQVGVISGTPTATHFSIQETQHIVNQFPYPPTDVAGSVTVTLAPAGGALSFDTGPRPMTWDSGIGGYACNGIVYNFTNLGGTYSLTTGGQTNNGSFTYALALNAGMPNASTFYELFTTDYPNSLMLSGLWIQYDSAYSLFIASPSIVADITASDGFHIELSLIMPDPSGYGGEEFNWISPGTITATLLQTNSPIIAAQPQSVAVHAHDTAAFSVTASGALPFSYQWSSNGTNIAGATSSTWPIPNVRESDLGTYAVVVTNSFGSVTSSNAVLSMYPFIVVPFAGAITYWGKSANFSVGAWGTGPLSYQWFRNGVGLQNATNATLSFASIQSTNAGLYSVVVTSPLGSVTNAPAQVIVYPAGVSLGFCPSVTISGVIGYSYIIERTADLTNTNSWVTLTNLTLTQPVQLWVDTNVDATSPFNSKYFYRVLPGQ